MAGHTYATHHIQQNVTKFIAMTAKTWVTPEAATKLELLLNKVTNTPGHS